MFLTAGFLAAGKASAATEGRVALVIGNGAYTHLPRLANPTKDAELIADTLQVLGFKLIGGKAHIDLDRAGFEHAIREFGAQLPGSAVGLFYYAGHGLQVQGANFLVPVAANPSTAADVDFELIDANVVLKQMESAGSTLNILILDACRNNPFGGRGLRDASAGLAPMQAPRGTLISYATQPGNVALDGDSGHSPYTRALAETMRRPGLRVLDAFNEVAVAVDKATLGRQQPWTATSPLEGIFYFLGPTTVNVTPAAPDAASSTSTAETVFWQTVAQSTNAADFDDFLKRYPKSEFASLAQRRRDGLAKPGPTTVPTPTAAVSVAKPVIKSVSSILPQSNQQIVITGSGFGKRAPYVGNSESIRLSTSTGWNAGSTRDPGGDLVTLAIRSWKDDEIVLDGFRGAYGQRGWKIDPGDTITIEIWNAGSAAGPGVLTASVAAAATAPQQPPAAATHYFEIQQLKQPESRDPNGKITVEAATIHVLACNEAPGPAKQIYVYEYANRPGFRAIQPPNWATALGGGNYLSFTEAATAGCRAVASPELRR